MGYYTDFNLVESPDFDKDPGLMQRCIEWAETEIPRVPEESWKQPQKNCWDLKELLEEGYVNTKWYDFPEEMEAFSKAFPEVKLRIVAEGEEAGDLWVAYVFDGKCLIGRGDVIYPPEPEGFR